VGSKREMTSNFRLIAATNRDLDQMMNEGKFRADLLFRLRSLSISLPPLCERVEDIRPMALHHMSRLCRVYNIEEKEFAPDVLDIFEGYEWPGNVRELVNTIDGMLALAQRETTLYAKHLPLNIRVKMVCDSFQDKPSQDTLSSDELSPSMSDSFPTFKDFKSSTEKKYLEDLMLSTHRNIQKACELSGISRSRLYELLSKYEINASA
jgi:two-component system NtrC family response regulator